MCFDTIKFEVNMFYKKCHENLLLRGLARFVVTAKQTFNYRIVFKDTLNMKCWCTTPLRVTNDNISELYQND